jgi:hypothetical protein
MDKTTKMATITLYFDPEAFKAETSDGLELDEDMLNSFGEDLNGQAAHFLGYSGWQAGWVMHSEDGFTQREFIEVDNDSEE